MVKSGWTIELSKGAEKDFLKLDAGIRKRILVKLAWLSENLDILLPSGLHAEFKGFYKLRIGEWRVIYKTNWDKKIIEAHYVDKRDKIYKDN